MAAAATIGITGSGAATALGPQEWTDPLMPVQDASNPAEWDLNNASVSFFAGNTRPNEEAELQEFVSFVSSFYADLLKKQEPLGREFAAVWDDHAIEMYGVRLKDESRQ